MNRSPLKIGALARAADVGVETIRYYQRRKLLATPPRPDAGQRLYPPEYVERLRFIKRAQALGFSLDEVAALLLLNDGTGHVRARQLATRRLGEIEKRIADLAAIRKVLDALVRECAHAEGRVPCPIIATLSRPAELEARRPRQPRKAAA